MLPATNMPSNPNPPSRMLDMGRAQRQGWARMVWEIRGVGPTGEPGVVMDGEGGQWPVEGGNKGKVTRMAREENRQDTKTAKELRLRASERDVLTGSRRWQRVL